MPQQLQLADSHVERFGRAARITVGVAPTTSVYRQMQARIGQNALRFEIFSPFAKL